MDYDIMTPYRRKDVGKMENAKEHKVNKFGKVIPDYPKFCRMCGAPMDRIDEQVIAYDIYTNEPRTYEYTYACRKDLKHTQLKVAETPANEFRCVIRADRYDRTRVIR